jgi:hypothetical protein
MPNFIEIGPVVWISIADTHGTHIDFYILDNTINEEKPYLPFSNLANHTNDSLRI